MTVNISLFAGAGAQFFDNNGVPLSGGLLYTYAAGTTTPTATYTSSSGGTANSNPIVLDSAGRPPSEIWLTTGSSYKFVLQTSLAVSIGTWDNVPGVNDFSVLTSQLANQSNAALGDALIGFKQANNSGLISGAVGRTVHQKLQDLVSAKDFGAKGDGTTDDTTAIQAAIYYAQTNGGCVYLPAGTYIISNSLNVQVNSGGLPLTRPSFRGDGAGATTILQTANASGLVINGYTSNPADYMYISDMTLQSNATGGYGNGISFSDSAFVNITNVEVTGWENGVYGIDSLSLTFTRLASRFNINGFRFESSGSGTGYTSEPNAITMLGCTIGNNTTTGGWVVGAGTFTFVGGSIESNGVSTAMSSSKWGLRITNSGGNFAQESANGFSLQGVYFEGNGGQANLWVEQSVSRPGVTGSVVGCSFIVLGNSYPAASVYLAASSSTYAFPVSFNGCGWSGLNVYTPSSSRPTINNVSSVFPLALTGCSFYSTTDQYKQGAPNRYEGNVEAVGYYDLNGNPIGSGGTGSLNTVLTVGNTSSLNGIFGGNGTSTGVLIGTKTYSSVNYAGIGAYPATLYLANGASAATTYAVEFNNANFQPAVDSSAATALTLGAASRRWNGFYLNNAFNWNSYSIPAPGGSTLTFLRNDGTWATPSGGGSGVSTFNTRVGAVTLLSADVTGALGFTPYADSNPNGYITGSGTAANANNLTGTLYTSSYTLLSTTSLVAIGNSSGFGVFVNSSTNFAPSFDNIMTCGSSGFRWTTVYATTGTINTSDATQKEQIADLTAAELAVAKRIKGLFKTFKFKDAVVAKGDGARIHVGVMAQDVQAAFAAEGLDANKYGLFCSDTVDGVTTLGVRYEELLAFVIAAL
jgi:hypothetical protein